MLVVGVESLLTSLARCCRPAPPDAIGGFVTRGKGVAIHRADCSNFRQMASALAERVIAVAVGRAARRRGSRCTRSTWSSRRPTGQGLLRDISEVFAKEKMNVIGVQTQSVQGRDGGTAWMTFTVEVGRRGAAGAGAGAGGARAPACAARAPLKCARRASLLYCAASRRRVAQLVRAPP